MTSTEYIENIKATRGQWAVVYDSEGNELLHENHHIKPRCKGGKPEQWTNTTRHPNLVWLLPREHFEVHRLQAEENPDDYDLQCAYWCLAQAGDGKYITAEEYEAARIQHAKAASEFMKQFRAEHKLVSAMKDKHFSAEAIANMAAGWHLWWDSLSEEQRAKQKKDRSERMKRTNAAMSKEKRKEIGLKGGATRKGKSLSDEHRKHISDARKGKPSPLKGTHLSAIAKQHVSEAKKGKPNYKLRGRKQTDEQRIKLARTRNKYIYEFEDQLFYSKLELQTYIKNKYNINVNIAQVVKMIQKETKTNKHSKYQWLFDKVKILEA